MIKINQFRIWPTYTAKKSNSTSYHTRTTKVIHKELHNHHTCKEWTRPLHVLLAAQYPLQTRDVMEQVKICFHWIQILYLKFTGFGCGFLMQSQLIRKS